MILIDTSAWIEYDRATGSPVHRRVAGLVRSEGPIVTTQPVIMEVAAGALTQAREDALRAFLARWTLLHFDDSVDFDGAVSLYRKCRMVGMTPRGLLDCMIAAVALRHGASLLAQDSDLRRVAEVVGIALDDPGS